MASPHVEAIVLISLHIAVVAGVGLRVILGRHAPGSSFAWLLLTAVLPGIGAILYALIGERPIGKRRADFARAFYAGLPAVVDRVGLRVTIKPKEFELHRDILKELALAALAEHQKE